MVPEWGTMMPASARPTKAMKRPTPPATAPALVLVGALMMGALAEIDWADPGVAIPAFLTVIMIPLTYSIANGLAFGITAYAILKLVRGQARLGDWLVYVLAALCIVRFIYLA